MADNQDGSEKTEDPTGKRKSQARADGQVAKSTDFSQVLGLIGGFLALQLIGPWIWDDLVVLTTGALSGVHASDSTYTIDGLRYHFYGLVLHLLPEVLLVMVVAAFLGAGSIALQTQFLWSKKLLIPKFKNLNPITGIKRIFSLQNSVTVLKSIAKLFIICPVAYFAFIEIFPNLLGLMDVPIANLLPYTSSAAALIFWRIIALLFVLSVGDYIWQWWRNLQQLKMTKNEVKDEKKAIEGDEATRMQIRQKAMQRTRERMMADVPLADVVVTNPTHLAVALKYTLEPGTAPIVVAKGRGHVAERIKKVARENGVVVLERKQLARALFKAVEIGQQIPYELYAAIAEVLAYVYKLKGNNPFVGDSSQTSAET